MKIQTLIAVIIISPVLLSSFGCGQHKVSLPPARYIAAINDDPPVETADFNRPFEMSNDDVMNGEFGGMPVSAAKALAYAAGGDWVVIAPKPFDSVKGLEINTPQTFGNPVPVISVGNKINLMVKSGTPIAYDSSHRYVFMVFGSTSDLTRYEAAPPDPITGMYLRGRSLESALNALADSRHEKITIDSAVTKFWTTYENRYRSIEMQLGQVSAQDSLTYGGGSPEVTVIAQTCFEYTSVRRMSEADMMNGIALSAGAEAQQISPKSWNFSELTESNDQQVSVAKIKSAILQAANIDDESPNPFGVHTSYADRHSGNAAAAPVLPQKNPTQDQLAQLAGQLDELSQVQEQVSSGLNELALTGTVGYSDLTGFLSNSIPPQVTCGAMLALASEGDSNSNAQTALNNFIGSLVDFVGNGNENLDQIAELRYGLYLLRSQSELDGTLSQSSQEVLTKTALSATIPTFISSFARASLLENGVVPGSDAPWIPSAEETFSLTPPPVGHGMLLPIATTSPDAIRPLATTKAANGDVWGVFCSGRLGNPLDLWLARAVNGRWCEFLFTGQEYTEGGGYGVYTGPTVGGCKLLLSGIDTVIIKPSNPAAIKLSNLTTAYYKTMISDTAKAASISSQLSSLQQSVGSSLSTTYRLSLSQLRKDSDGDGLSDVVEERLGTDPNNHETSSNSVPDSADQNPLVKGTPENRDSRGRQIMLQKIFDALYGSSTEPDPIVVVLDKPFQQQFHGGGARVLCLSPSHYIENSSNFGSLRALNFGGPTDAKSSILHPDGPCLYSDDGSSVEVHFWTSTGPMMMFRAPQATKDYIAIFGRTGDDWILKSIEPWHFTTSSAASMASIVND